MTTGTADAVDITFPGLSVFDTLTGSAAEGSDWAIQAQNSTPNFLFLEFTTTPTRGSLVGLDGGIILSGTLAIDESGLPLYETDTGTITPVPEPSLLGILAVALLAFVGIVGLRKRKPTR